MKPKFVPASPDNFEAQSQLLFNLTPEQFFCLVRLEIEGQSNLMDEDEMSITKATHHPETFSSSEHLNRESVSRLRERMEKNQEIDIPSISIIISEDDEDPDVLHEHSGRHRAYVAYKLGIDKIPVTIFVEDSDYINVKTMTDWQRNRLKHLLGKCKISIDDGKPRQ